MLKAIASLIVGFFAFVGIWFVAALFIAQHTAHNVGIIAGIVAAVIVYLGMGK